jgi:hypothetical protein
MQDILNAAPAFVSGLQNSNLAMLAPVLTVLLALTLPLFYFLVLPALYWCFDSRLALRLMILACLSAFIANILEASLRHSMSVPVGFVFFSSPLVVAASLWLTVSGGGKKKLWLLAGLVVPAALALAHLYAGQLVLLGAVYSLITGWVLAAVWLAVGSRFELRLARLHPRIAISLAALVAFAMNALQMGNTGLPGLLLGTVVGSSFLFWRFAEPVDTTAIFKRLLRLLPGFGGLFVLDWLARQYLPLTGHSLYPLMFFVYSFLQGLWCTLANPLLCIRLSLAGSRSDHRKA